MCQRRINTDFVHINIECTKRCGGVLRNKCCKLQPTMILKVTRSCQSLCTVDNVADGYIIVHSKVDLVYLRQLDFSELFEYHG